jgi:hypothetical protein
LKFHERQQLQLKRSRFDIASFMNSKHLQIIMVSCPARWWLGGHNALQLVGAPCLDPARRFSRATENCSPSSSPDAILSGLQQSWIPFTGDSAAGPAQEAWTSEPMSHQNSQASLSAWWFCSLSELELELIQAHMTQKPMLRVEMGKGR